MLLAQEMSANRFMFINFVCWCIRRARRGRKECFLGWVKLLLDLDGIGDFGDGGVSVVDGSDSSLDFDGAVFYAGGSFGRC